MPEGTSHDLQALLAERDRGDKAKDEAVHARGDASNGHGILLEHDEILSALWSSRNRYALEH